MVTQNLEVGQSIHGFHIDRIENIPELRSQAAIFTHEKTGARFLHLFNEDPNNLFCIAFRTPVYNNTGVPHILEHSVLSGSKKFPLKDPFKEMLKSSLHTFLNAITYPDKTLYPVSSQVEQDFFNLVNVYCDAVFNPLLTEMTFAQEGWHFDLENPDDPISIKGLVYNEMKGVFSDFRNHVALKTLSNLFPDTTYYSESGGDPENITDLTYMQFKEFHDRYYHPSNSFTFLYGNIPSEKTLLFLQENYLFPFDYRKVDSEIVTQPVWDRPHSIRFEAPASKEDDGTASVIISWIICTSTDPLTSLLGKIFSHYLFNNQSSPLRRALVDSKLGEDLDDITGFDNDFIQGMFCAGLRKTKPEHAEKIKSIIFNTLEKEISKKLDNELLEGSIRQTEFMLREISDSTNFPYNLMLAERAFRSWIYRGDPLVHLCYKKPLEIIKKKKQEGTAFFTEKMKELLLENPHNLLSIVIASSKLGDQLGKKSEQQAASLSSAFTSDDKINYYNLTLKLLEEQKKKPSPEVIASLPRLKRSDIPLNNEKIPFKMESAHGVPVYTHPLFTAGIVYLDIGFDLSCIPQNLLLYFPLYSEMLTRCGAAGNTYEDMAKRISLSTGGIGCSDICKTRFSSENDLVFKSFFHGKALPERFNEMIAIFKDIFCEPELDNTKLIGDIILEMRNALYGSVIRNGHTFAVSHASSRISKSRYIEENLDGITQLRFLDNLVKRSDIRAVTEAMKKLHESIVNRNNSFISLTTENPEYFLKVLDAFLQNLPSKKEPPTTLDFKVDTRADAFGIEINSSVNYVARAWRLGKLTPATAGRLHLLSRNLSTGLLWDKIRVEGGAYGGMAFSSSSHPVFSCASYRDPNLERTLDNFQYALERVSEQLSEEEIVRSIIGTIGNLDHPRSPHSKGFEETIALLCGSSPEIRQDIRDAILNSTPKIIAKQAQKLLEENLTTTSVLASTTAFDNSEKKGYVFIREPLIKNGDL